MSTALAIATPHIHTSPTASEKLGAEITELCSYIFAAEARLLTLIREFDENKHWEPLGMCSCAHWLNFKCGVGMNAAREKIRVAHALAKLPGISVAFENGQLSYSKVRAMTRIADAGNEEYLLMIAKHGTAHHVEKLVSKFRTARRLQDAELAHEQYRDREVTHYYDHDGCLIIKARMPAEQGALIVKALEMAMDKDFAKNEVCPTGTCGADKVSVGQASDEREPIAARRADALAEIAETYMNNNESSGSTADRYQVVVHVTADNVPLGQASHLEDGPGVTAGTSHLENGPGVTAETSRRIACDSSVVRIHQDQNGEPLSIGRRSRSIPPPMRRALRVRDGSCRFPGCTNTRFVDGHHIEHWADGGETGLSNLVLLCRHHHHLVHEGGFVCEKTIDGEVFFRDRRAQVLKDSSELPRCAAGDDIRKWLDREFFEADIDHQTCAAQWHAGTTMDWQMAVSALF